MKIDNVKVIGLFGGGSLHSAQLCVFFAQYKYEVYLSDRNGSLLVKSKENLEKLLERLLYLGKKKEEINEIRNRIKITIDFVELCKNADIVIDTHKFFNFQIQHLLLANYFCKPETIFTLNFSDKILLERVSEFSKPRKIIGLHFSPPFLARKQVDIIKTSITSNDTVRFLHNFFKSLNVKVRFYETNLLKSTIYLKKNKLLNQILWFRNQFIKRTSYSRISFKKNLRIISKYYYKIYQKLINLFKSPIRTLKWKFYLLNIQFYKFFYKKKDATNLMVNLGGGIDYVKHWKILDMHSNWFRWEKLFIDYFFDMGKNDPFPFKDNSVKFFYSANCLEHIPPEVSQKIFDEIYRCLKPGGGVRLNLFDFDLAYKAYGKKDENFFYNVPRGNIKKKIYASNIDVLFLNFFATYCAFNKEILKNVEKNYKTMKKEDFANYYINLISRDWQNEMVGGNINWYNYEKTENMLKIAGFKNIYLLDYQKSKFVDMRTPPGKYRFVHVEAIK